MDRREALALLASLPLATAFSLEREEVARAQMAARSAGADFTPSFFNQNGYRTVGALADLIIPRDERSGSASDAHVPEFIDFMMIDQPDRQVAMRGGLAWLDLECGERFGKRFVECAAEERNAMLEAIAWPERAAKELSHGVEFFSRFRDLTATGFFTSKMGFEDLDYRGNEFVTEWKGCPAEALRKIGLG